MESKPKMMVKIPNYIEQALFPVLPRRVCRVVTEMLCFSHLVQRSAGCSGCMVLLTLWIRDRADCETWPRMTTQRPLQ